ncbi:hypothetical protein NFI96_000488 [Prochilodus magdalenae]|nr:hypothetical protein NFI96_000488 [Prochilodus magdalenae]
MWTLRGSGSPGPGLSIPGLSLESRSQSEWSLLKDLDDDDDTYSVISWPSRIRVRERRAREDSLGRASDSGSDVSSLRHHPTVAPLYLAPHSEPANQMRTRSAEPPVQQQNLNAELLHHHRAQSAERPQYQRTQSNESAGYQRVSLGEHQKYQHTTEAEPHGVRPSTVGHQADYRPAQQPSSRYTDVRQPPQTYGPPQQSYPAYFQQPLPSTGDAPQPDPRYRDSHPSAHVGGVAHQPSQRLPPKYDHASHVSQSYGPSQQFVPGYTHGQPPPYKTTGGLPPTYDHAPPSGPAHSASKPLASLNGDTAHSSPGPPKVLESHEPPDPRGHPSVPRVMPSRESLESRQRASTDPPVPREGRAASRGDVHSEGLLKSRKAVLPSEIRRRERSVDPEEASESRRSRRISQLEEAKGRGGERIRQGADEGAGRGRRRISNLEAREGHDERRARQSGDEEGRGERRISQLQERVGKDEGGVSQSQEPLEGLEVRKDMIEHGHRKLEERQRRDVDNVSRLEEVQQHAEGQIHGKTGWLEEKLLWDGRRIGQTGDPVMQVQGDKSMRQLEVRHGQTGQGITPFSETKLKEDRNVNELDKMESEVHQITQKDVSEGYGRRRRISQSENDEGQIRRRRISQTEEDWKGRRVHRISQSEKWDGRDQTGQSGRQGEGGEGDGHLPQNRPEDMDTTPPPQQANEPSDERVPEVGGYLQTGSSLPQARHRGSKDGGDLKPKVRTRSMSDIGVTQRSAVFRSLERAASRESVPIGRETGTANGEVGTLDTRVSVAKLRHSYLENASGRKPELESKVEPVVAESDATAGVDRERGPRRPRRYITPSDDRKASERFRTQPITSAERLESDRSRLSPTELQKAEADEEKLDERAKMSVAAKRSLFRLEHPHTVPADGAVGVEVEGHQAFWTCDGRPFILVLTTVPPHTDSLGVSTKTKAGLVTEDDPLPF